MTPRFPSTIRRRLALAIGGLTLAASVLIGVTQWTLLRGTLEDEFAARLEEDYERVEHGFEVLHDGRLLWREDHMPAPAHGDEGEVLAFEIRDAAGSMLLRRPEDGLPYAGPWRKRAGTYEVGDRIYDIAVFRSPAAMDAELARHRGVLWMLLPLAFLVSLVGGWWLAGRVLRPVQAMAGRARRIGSENLGERLPVGNPDDELGTLATTFNEAFARIEAGFERLRRFTADASHELRTPLAVMRSAGEVALGDGREAALRDAISTMLEESERLSRLVEDLLLLSRGDADAAPAALEPLALGEVAEEVVAGMRVLAEERGVSLEVVAEDAANATGERPLLRQAILNLVDNAIRHAPEGSPVEVRCGTADGQAYVEVVDEGPGIPPEHAEKVFERFYRVDPSRTGHGAGVGLSIARWATMRSGGTLTLEPNDPRGCRFRMSFPSA